MNSSAHRHRHRRLVRTALLLVLALLWQPLWPLLAAAGDHAATVHAAAAEAHCAEMPMPAGDCCDDSDTGAPPCDEDPFCVATCTLLRASTTLPSMLSPLPSTRLIGPVPAWHPTPHPAGPSAAPPLRPPISA